MRYLALAVLAFSVLLLGCTSDSQPTPTSSITAPPSASVSVSATPTSADVATPSPSVSETPAPSSASVNDCGTVIWQLNETPSTQSQYSCFTAAAQNCDSAKLTWQYKDLNVFGTLLNGVTVYEIKGEENGKCLLNKKIIDYSAAFSPEIEAMMTPEQLQQLADVSASLVGQYQTCRYTPEELVKLLNDEASGNLSGGSGDYEKYGCEGTLGRTANTAD